MVTYKHLKQWSILFLFFCILLCMPAQSGAQASVFDGFTWNGSDGTMEVPVVSERPTIDGVLDSIYMSGISHDVSGVDATLYTVNYDNTLYSYNDWRIGNVNDPLGSYNAWQFGMPSVQGGVTNRWLEIMVDDDSATSYDFSVTEWYASDPSIRTTTYSTTGTPIEGVNVVSSWNGVNWVYEIAVGLEQSIRAPDEQLPVCWTWEWKQIDPDPFDWGWEQVYDGNVHATPEPCSILLFGSGLAGLIGIGRKKIMKKG